jgi:hypothetical protein
VNPFRLHGDNLQVHTASLNPLVQWVVANRLVVRHNEVLPTMAVTVDALVQNVQRTATMMSLWQDRALANQGIPNHLTYVGVGWNAAQDEAGASADIRDANDDFGHEYLEQVHGLWHVASSLSFVPFTRPQHVRGATYAYLWNLYVANPGALHCVERLPCYLWGLYWNREHYRTEREPPSLGVREVLDERTGRIGAGGGAVARAGQYADLTGYVAVAPVYLTLPGLDPDEADCRPMVPIVRTQTQVQASTPNPAAMAWEADARVDGTWDADVNLRARTIGTCPTSALAEDYDKQTLVLAPSRVQPAGVESLGALRVPTQFFHGSAASTTKPVRMRSKLAHAFRF